MKTFLLFCHQFISLFLCLPLIVLFLLLQTLAASLVILIRVGSKFSYNYCCWVCLIRMSLLLFVYATGTSEKL